MAPERAKRDNQQQTARNRGKHTDASISDQPCLARAAGMVKPFGQKQRERGIEWQQIHWTFSDRHGKKQKHDQEPKL